MLQESVDFCQVLKCLSSSSPRWWILIQLFKHILKTCARAFLLLYSYSCPSYSLTVPFQYLIIHSQKYILFQGLTSLQDSVCVCVYVWVCLCVCMCMCLWTCLYVCAMHASECMGVCTHVHALEDQNRTLDILLLSLTMYYADLQTVTSV